ncbi:hypothetical protein [Kitasatospora sp. NPDC057198]|uniref:hypothetical protein n=1 Tax=Kitasatospora sp. NPDC057198 TaxID=3346046 RepID=UPI00362CBBF3
MTGEGVQVSPADYNELVNRTRLETIFATELHARRLSPALPARVSVNSEIGLAVGENLVDYQLQIQCHFVDDKDEPVAEASTVVAARYLVAEGTELPEAVFHLFGERAAAFMIYPYARQHLTDLTTRLGLPGFYLDVMVRDAIPEVDTAAVAPQ